MELEEYYVNGQYSKIVELTEDIDHNSLNKDNLVRIKSLRELSKYDTAINQITCIMETYKEKTDNEAKMYYMALLIEYLYVLYRLEDYTTFEKINKKVGKINEEIEEDDFILSYRALWYYVRGNIQWIKNKIRPARNNYNKSLELSRTLGDDRFRIRVENALGNLYLKENKYNLSLEHYQSTLELAEKYDYLKFILYAHINLSNVYRSQGFLEKALDHLNEALAFEDKIQNLETQGVLETNLGIIYYHLGQYNAAKEHFSKAITALKPLTAYSHISEALFYYLLTLRETDQGHKFEENLEYFRIINEKSNNSIISFRYDLASAIYYSDKHSIISKAEAMKILSQLQGSKLSDEFFSLLSSIHACNLFIEELILYFDIDVLEKVKSIIEDLKSIAINQDSHMIKVETNRLVAKIERLEGNAEEALTLFQEAIDIADKYHLTHLKNKTIQDLKELKLEDEVFPSGENDSHQLNPILYKEQLYSYQIFLHPIRLCVFKELIQSWTISSSQLRKLIKTSWGKLLTHINKMEEEGMIEYRNGFEGGSVVKVIELTTYGEDKYKEFKKFMEYNM